MRCWVFPVASWARVNCTDTHTLQWYVCVLVLYRDFDGEVSGNYKKIYDVKKLQCSVIGIEYYDVFMQTQKY